MPNSPQNNEQLTALVQRIDALITNINQRFDEVRSEMKLNMEKYVLTAVHDLEIKRLDDKDKEQEEHLQRLEDRVLSQGQRYLLYACSGAGLISTIIVIAHALHML